jgi:hypothetical protein
VTTLYRIHTEDRDNLATLANQILPGFTLLKGTGYYDHQAEPAAIIEYYGIEMDRAEVFRLARTIAVVNDQQSVLVAEMGDTGLGVTNVERPRRGEVLDFPQQEAA